MTTQAVIHTSLSMLTKMTDRGLPSLPQMLEKGTRFPFAGKATAGSRRKLLCQGRFHLVVLSSWAHSQAAVVSFVNELSQNPRT